MADDYGSSVGAGNIGNLAIGGFVDGNREVALDEDWFRVTLTAGTSYIFKMDRITIPDPALGLLDSNGIAIPGAFNDDVASGQVNAEVRFTASVSGTYYLRATSVTGNDVGTYRVSAAIDPNPPVSNDDFGQQVGAPNLGSVAIGGSTTGNLETGTDTDWFAVTLTAGTAYIFRQEGITQTDPLLRLRDANGVALAGNDDGGGGTNAQINYTAAVSGTHYLEASRAGANETGTYRVTAAVDGSPPPPPVDDFGSQAGANNLGGVTVGSSSTGTINSAGDHDWFAVTLSAGSQYRFRQEAGTLVDPRLTLRNSIGVSLAGDDDSGGGKNAQLDFTATSSGVYYIDANSADAAGTGTYTVRATLLYGAPVIVTNAGSTAAEGGTDTITASELSTTDPDSAASAITYTLTGLATNGSLTRNGTAIALNGTFTQADINANAIVYNHNGSETTSAGFAFAVTDGTTTFTGQTFNITVTPVNDAPVLGGAAFTAGYVENAPATIIAPAITVSDADSATLAGATVTISVRRSAGDTLGFVNQNGIAGSYNAGTGVLTLSGTSSVANYQAALRSIGFYSTSENPLDAQRTISIVTTDGAATSNEFTSFVAVTPVNDLPVIGNGGNTVNYVENESGTVVNGGITIADVDNDELVRITVSITSGFVLGDQLTITRPGGFVGGYTPSTGVLRLQNLASVETYQDMLRSVRFSSTSDNPGSGSRTITFVATDENGSSVPVTSTVTVTPVNDAPTATNLSAPQTYVEDVTLDLTDIVVADLDSATVTATLTLSNPAAGRLTTGTSGATSSSYDAATGVYTATGTIAEVNTLLAGARFVPAANFNGNLTIATSVSDGVAAPITGSIALTGTSVNDAPAGTDGSVAALTDTLYTFTVGNFAFTDVEGNALAGVVIATLPGSGTLQVGGTAATVGQFVAAATITAGGLTYLSAPQSVAATSFTFQVRDTGGTVNGGQDTDQSANTLTVNVASIAGSVVIGDATVTEGGTATLTLTRSGGTGAFAVDYGMSNGAPGLASATAGADYISARGTVSFAAGQNSATITVATIDDSLTEASEGITVTLASPTAGATIADATGVVTITDNDFPLPPDTSVPTNPLPPTNPANPSANPVTVGDMVYVDNSYTLPTGSPATVLTTRNNSGTTPVVLTGNSGNQTIVGNFGDNTLDGAGGSDTLIGLNGNDTYIVSSTTTVVVELPDAGTDTVVFNIPSTSSLPKDAQAAATPTPTFVLPANASVEIVRIGDPGSTAAVNIIGSTASQAITGNNGDNIINGFGGNDTMTGLGGNDTYLVRGPGDVVIEANGGGTDTIYTTVSYNLGANEIEILSTVTQSETTPIDLIGNYATQYVIGNYGNNVLNGGSGGLDTLIGLRGDDTYAVGDSRTVIVEAAGEGSDTVVVAVDYTLAAGVSVEVLAAQDRAGTAPLALRGNEVAQTIAGNAGANTIDGGLGADTLIGGAGADTFAFTTAPGAGNVDTLADFVVGTDRIGLAANIFAAVTSGGIAAAEFVIGTAATTADSRLIYDQASGRLFYDADANGAGAAVLFAQLAPNTALTAADFVTLPPVA